MDGGAFRVLLSMIILYRNTSEPATVSPHTRARGGVFHYSGRREGDNLMTGLVVSVGVSWCPPGRCLRLFDYWSWSGPF